MKSLLAAIVVGLAAQASLATETASAARAANNDKMCFIYVGSQDKPMPEFCIATGGLNAVHMSKVLFETTSERIAKLSVDTTYDHVLAEGGYQITDGRLGKTYLTRDDARRVVKEILHAFRQRNIAVPDVLERTYNRLTTRS